MAGSLRVSTDSQPGLTRQLLPSWPRSTPRRSARISRSTGSSASPSTWTICCRPCAAGYLWLRKDVDGRTDVGPVPGKLGLVVANAKAPVGAGVAPVAAPVVVVNAGAV